MMDAATAELIQRALSRHVTPEFYRTHGYCETACRECEGLDARDIERRATGAW